MAAPTLAGLAVLFAVLFVIFRALEFLLPLERRTPLLRRGLLTDVSYWVFSPYVAHYVVEFFVLLAVGAFAFAVYGRIDQAEITHGFGPFSRLPLAVSYTHLTLPTNREV